MGDPIWLDTNAVQYALNGDPAVNEQLSNFRKAGRKLLVPPAVANELLNGNVLTMKPGRPVWQQVPSPQLRAALEKGLEKAGITVDWNSRQVPQPQRVDNYGIPSSVKVSESDRLVLGQIKAGAKARGVAKPQMLTGEGPTKPMHTQASKWGIESIATAKSPPGSAPPTPPRVDLGEDFPPEREGPISRFFRDRPMLKKIGLIGVNLAAQYISQKMMSSVEEYYAEVIEQARQELEAQFPDPEGLKPDLDRYRRAYEASLAKVAAPGRARVAEALILAFTRDRDIEKVKKYLDDQISKVQSAADGSVSGYSKVANEYIDLLVALYKRTNEATQLAAIAADIEKRGSIIMDAGESLEQTYWTALPAVVAFPFAYYAWFEVHSVAQVLKRLGGLVNAFASEVAGRHRAYEALRKQLDEQLIKVSNELAKYAP